MDDPPQCLHNGGAQSTTTMRLRLVHTLSLLLLSAVLLAVLAMGAVTAWNLRNGFADYLVARDVERLEQFAAFLGQSAEQAGGLQAMREGGLDIRGLMDQFALREGIRPSRPPPGERPGFGPFRPPPDGRPPHAGPDAFGERVWIVQLDGKPLWGAALTPDRGALVERPVRVRGELVALARMFKLRVVSDDIDAKFLNSQYGGIVGVALALLVLALASAWWVARRWVRPLLAAQDATLRIAQGEFAIRLNPSRTDEIGDLMRNINAMAQALAQLDAQRRRWIADISHELRTPLAVLRGEIEALVDGVRPLQPAAMVSLREEVLHLGSLVEDLHLLAMSDLKALPCYFEEQDALALAQKVMQRFELRAQQSDLSLQLSAPQQEGVPVRWDGRRIEQLLGNLLDNSLRYTDAPGCVRLTLQIDAGEVLIDLDDSAPGVPAVDAARLFEPLYRADAARSRHTGGSGLGLAICHAIVQAHGGAITATASELGGLRIRIRLPRLAGEGAC